MTLNAIFKKPVDRPIEGVIKADDEASLRLEIEEYVLTNEVEKRLESFLEAYNKYEGANGVWISGFFGSGKSHLLKMLALVIENREIDGASALDLFLPKSGDNAILRGGLKRAAGIPSKSILFNIDQKADVISKTQIDALLAVFVKVFDEMCGYYGKQGYIAQFERDLDSRGVYEQFKSAYEATVGKPWSLGREQALLEGRNIARAYARATGEDEASATGILDKYRSQYQVSIEDFAEKVDDYIQRQGAGFRLNFFVDEVGQYIADNIKLMTNLQTIAESLATKCRGRAWIIVTAQEDMGTVVGEMGQREANDFSKIQARFANRLKLTSADVAEVIQKRLLAKNEEGNRLLAAIYQAQANNFKTLFDFADGSQTYRNFTDLDHFINSYPFIPYQFALFQAAIQNLSLHNAFEGKHSSVGERSMLGVFQQVAIKIGNNEIGQLATFDLMFEGIRAAVKAQIQRAIIQAENHLESPFAIRLLKALFLVKYIKEFKPTIRNLCILLLDSFSVNLPDLKERVVESLNLLEQQTYIQRQGELYEYLTDEEKDVEAEIKNTEVQTADVAAEIANIVFDQIIKQPKIRYDQNGQDYPFSRRLDDRLLGREHELSINVISPFHENADKVDRLVLQSSIKQHELLVVMAQDDRLVSDILMYKRTEKYIRQNTSVAQQEAVKRILDAKGSQNRERQAELKQRVQGLLGQARLFLAGQEAQIAFGDPLSRVVQGFHELMALAYPNLRMLRGVTYTESDLAKYLRGPEGLLGNEASPLAESEQEMLAFIQRNNSGGARTTLKTLWETFERKPYGWYYWAVICLLASLCARGKVEVSADSNPLEDQELERALRNTHGHGNVVLTTQVEFTASQVRALKEFYQSFFDVPAQANEAKALGRETEAAIQGLLQQLTPLQSQAGQYPFLIALSPVIDKITEISGQPYGWHLTELPHRMDALLDLKEGVIDPIRKFMSGPQKAIYEKAREFVQAQEPNFAYIKGDEAAQVVKALTDPECFKGHRIQQMKANLDALQQKVADQVELEITRVREAVMALKGRLAGLAEFKSLNSEQQARITGPFDGFTADVEKQKLIAVIRDTLRRFEENDYQSQLSQMTTTNKTEPPIEYVPGSSVRVAFDKAWLADARDVERYLECLRKALLEEIGKGKRVRI
ncbi:MAG: BREX system P-loop protein BrxC [Candidatus Adiutrix sp.]|jgi:hypothetical protein|nr:BREX system P-loop protein BrxC [Candidatus Adiutrix sp.]